MTERYRSFAEFWPFYVFEHSNRTNRRLHAVGTSLGLILAAAAYVWHPPLWAVVPIVGYGFAWVGHYKVQRNRPATFQYPLYSFCGDFKMLGYMCTGRMDDEVVRCTELHKAALASARSGQDSKKTK